MDADGYTLSVVTAPATPEAEQWQGWGTALKPAFEPVVVGRKPFKGNVAANVLTHGTGALNIDACRIGTTRAVPASHSKSASTVGAVGISGKRLSSELDPNMGRWPANVVLDSESAAVLDEQSGNRPGNKGLTGTHGGGRSGGVMGKPQQREYDFAGYGDSGGASRFYFTAKADTAERPTHHGTAHPTVKPLDLMRWLCRLVTPPGGLILDPFAGSGTTVEAAHLERFRCLGIEREADYLPLIVQRLHRRADPIAYLTNRGDDLGLFAEDDT